MFLAKGTFPFANSAVQLISGGGGQYEVIATVTNPGPTAPAQLVFYWAQAMNPPGTMTTNPPQLYGWSLPAYVQPTVASATSNPTAQFSVPGGGGIAISGLVWQPDVGILTSIANSYDPGHIMIIAQLIYFNSSGVVSHPVDYSWWPGPQTYTAAGIFSWP